MNISSLFNNKAFGKNGNFDHVGTSFSIIETKKKTVNHTLEYDNIEIDYRGRVINIENNIPFGALYVLASTSHGPLALDATIFYHDKTQDTTTISLPDWQDEYVDEMERYQAIQYSLNNNNRGTIYHLPVYVNPSKVPVMLQFSNFNHDEAALHIFSVTGYPMQNDVLVSNVKVTHEWVNRNDQILSVKLHNTGTSWVRNANVHVTSQQVETIKQGFVSAIAPGHVHTTQVVVRNQGDQENQDVTVTVKYKVNKQKKKTYQSISLNLKSLQDLYEPTTESVQQHRSPTWLKNSKFGIFIHWGLYTVPAWAPVGKTYAEWYWWNMHHKQDPTFQYHLDTYGTNFTYDDFLNLWKPTAFNPNTWLDLVDKSGARYFVFTTKHHDGIALFNTSVTNRSSMKLMFPNRDFVRELLEVSEKEYPHLKRGLYFSLPEWYHPKYRDDTIDWHGPPINPYTNQRVAYTGSTPINDFVNELQVPQFQELIHQYSPDILWCDIGGINNSTVWQADYFNHAILKGYQVAVNDRCGHGSASDFTTIEYKAVSDTPSRFWEATRGMDPYSFGFNKQTKPDEYATTKSLLENLIDSISRGGNFLLNIGPESSGIVPAPMVERLLTIGNWLDKVEESVFDAVPYWINTNEHDLRFMASNDGRSVYVFILDPKPYQTIEIKTPLPIQSNTNIKLLNGNNAVEWDIANHSLVLQHNLSEQDIQQILIPVIKLCI